MTIKIFMTNGIKINIIYVTFGTEIILAMGVGNTRVY